MKKLDFEQLVPDPVPAPVTPECEYADGKRWVAGVYVPAKCRFRSKYRIGGKHYCSSHAAKEALAYLRRQALDGADDQV